MAAFGLVALVACSSDDKKAAEPSNTDAGPQADTGTQVDAAPAPFELKSEQIKEGESFPEAHTCTGDNTSPAFSWGPGPAGTLSYAIVLKDRTISFLHSSIYDIPATTLSLPANLEAKYAPSEPAGAHQTKGYDNATFGYIGPCPPTGEHVYEFTLYALDVASLSELTQTSTLKVAEATIKKHSLGTSVLSGKYKQP